MERIIVFGKGNYFKFKEISVLKEYKIDLFLDNSVKRNNIEYYGDMQTPVINPESLNLSQYRDIPIFLMSLKFIEMWKQLMRLGVSPHQIYIPIDFPPSYRDEDTLRQMGIKIECRDKYNLILIYRNKELLFSNEEQYRRILQECYREHFPFINAISQMNVVPASVTCGWSRGLPIDRVYIENFLQEHQQYIQGDVLEVADNTYTKIFGNKQVRQSYIMHADIESPTMRKINLETGEGIKECLCNCFILTQTLMYMYNLKRAIHNVFRLLKPQGVVLITCSGISPNAPSCQDTYGCYFNFNVDGLRELLRQEELCDTSLAIEVGSYGNVKTAVSHLAGLCKEDLQENDFFHNDPYYPVIVYAMARRR